MHPSEQFHFNQQQEKTLNFHGVKSNIHPLAAQLPLSSLGSSQVTTSVSTAAAGMMNRRPKINENNIKLIEKVIKRQNQTAQQDQRQHHNISTLLQHQNERAAAHASTLFEDLTPGNNNNNHSHHHTSGGSRSLVSHHKTPPPQLTLKSASPSHFSAKVEDGSQPIVATNYMSERIEKTLQKYSKKEIVKSATTTNSSANKQNSRNGGLFQAPSSSNNSSHFNQAINQVQKIYNTSTSLQSKKPTSFAQQQQQSPYINGATTLYNHKLLKKKSDIDQDGSSYSVDRLSNIKAKHQFYPVAALEGFSADKRGINEELSFESVNPSNNSFTMGQQTEIQAGVIPGVGGEDYPIRSMVVIRGGGNGERSAYIEETPQQVVKTASSNFRQMQSSPLEPMFISGTSTAAAGGRMYNNYGTNSGGGFISLKNNALKHHRGQRASQDLFFDDDVPQSQTNDSHLKSNQVEGQPLWSQQMLLQHQQQYIQALTLNGVVANTLSSYSKSRDGGYRNIPTRNPNDLSSISNQSPSSSSNKNALQDNTGFSSHHLNAAAVEEHPFKGPKLHHFKKDASRRIKTSSATRNLQPIFPFMENGGLLPSQLGNGSPFLNSKMNNFNSINIGGNNRKVSAPVNDSTGSIDNHENDQDASNRASPFSSINNQSPDRVTRIGQVPPRPNTTHLDQLLGSALKRESSDKVKEKLKEEINGFKHSFYNENKPQQLNSQRKKEKLEKTPPDTDPVKQIFVLDEEMVAASNTQSIQESKAMTPCFLHTPNMTNKWNDFKAPGNNIAQEYENEQQRHIHHQENRSEDVCETIEQPFFIKSGGQQMMVTPELLANAVTENLAKGSKPKTSHQNTKPERNLNLLMMMQNKQENSSSNSACQIKLCPQDIYLQSNNSAAVTTAKGSRNQLQQKPSSSQQSGGSFRRPLSRNHPVLSLVKTTAGTQQQPSISSQENNGAGNVNISFALNTRGHNFQGKQMILLNSRLKKTATTVGGQQDEESPPQ